MKLFYVLWTFHSNFSSLMPVEAESATQAIERTCGLYGEKFTKDATVYVFDADPALIVHEGSKMPRVAGPMVRSWGCAEVPSHIAQYREATRVK